MKRDWDTIRKILVKLEDVDPKNGALHLSDFPSAEPEKISYHVELLMEATLIYGKMSKTIGKGPYDFLAIRLTWQGHEFLDSIRNDKVWNKTKDSFISKGVSMTFELVKSVAIDITRSYLKSAMSS